MKVPVNTEIQNFMQEIFRTYTSLRNTKCGVEKTPFWDAVVLTTFDEAQRACFVEQVERKRVSGQLPQVPVYVVADPPGEKLGVGGSTLHVLAYLSAEFGVDLYKKKLLIIHSGGSSQRLPSYSVLGKIFAPVPAQGLCVSDGVAQMLDLKLALYLPLCRLLGPGAFVTCADDIETYTLDLDALDAESLASADVVALGHPSSLEVGKGHGVYVLKGGGAEVALAGTNSIQECLEVLQKPSISAMRRSGAVFCRDGAGGKQEEEEVWSDSVFWLSSGVCRRLLNWYIDNRPLPKELDAYAHILPCLGARMETAEAEDYADFRCQMLPLVRGASFKVITLPQSKFYHLGTMEEYLENFNCAEDFISELGLDRNTSNLQGKVCMECVRKEERKEKQEQGKGTVYPTRTQGTLIETHFLTTNIRIQLPHSGTRYVIEHCKIGANLKLTGDAILSNCAIVSCPTVPLPSDTVVGIPSGTLFHTAPITYQGQGLYVTVAFDLDARMKAEAGDLKDVQAFGGTLKDVFEVLGFTEKEMKEEEEKDGKVSLWNARIFPSAKTASESFWLTHLAVCRVKGECEAVLGAGKGVSDVLKGFGEADDVGCGSKKSRNKMQLFSMTDVVKMKDLNTLLEDRRKLVGSLGVGDVSV